MPSRCDEGQRGFALLLVFALAAAAAIFLYMQLPRVAFEAQRDREELLMQRGREYRRGIELYVRKNNKYPERLEDLERQQELRFVRRRHKDPMTGKDDWRIIRITAGGELENSLVKKKRAVGGQLAGNTAEQPEAPVAENTAIARQRSGEEMLANADFPGGGAGAGMAAGNGADGQAANGNPGGAANPLDAGLVPLLDVNGNLVQPGAAGQDDAGQGSTDPRTAPDGQQTDTAGAGGEPGQPRQPQLGPGGIPIIENPTAYVAGARGGQNAGQPGGGLGTGPPAVGAPPRGQLGQGQGQQQGQSAAGMIGNLLTTPVPGGLAGIQQRRGMTAAGAGAQGFGAGIAGVASRLEMRGIKVYEDQDSIHKWEFVFDARQQATRNQQAGEGGARTPTVPGNVGGFGTPGRGSNPTMNPGRQGGSGFGGFPQPGVGTPPAPPGRRR
ncbi:MAG: hypothetical protein MUF01_16255 [Bryobacterales bacterium]|nr:hypothetical protein [Bryobacterales bacterium]